MKKKNVLTVAVENREIAAAAHDAVPYVLLLYIAGTTPRAVRAIANVRMICEDHLAGRFDLEVIDISQYPALAANEQIIAAPTLIRKLPLPHRRFIGDMSETDRILKGLDLPRPVDKALPAGNR